MKCSKILIIIVLNLAFLQFGSTQYLQTGYTYNTKDSDLIVDQTADLKCGYLFYGLTQMRLIRLALIPPVSMSTRALRMLHRLLKTVKFIISTLYWLDRTAIGTLWLLQLYSGMTLSNFDFILKRSKTNFENDLPKIIKTHEYVIDKLQRAVGNCRENNTFHTKSEYEENRGKFFVDITNLAFHNSRNIIEMMKKNNTMFELRYELLNETLKPKRLLLNHLGINEKLQQELMTTYDVQVNWGDTSKQLGKAWLNAHDMDWPTNNLRNLEIYYTLNFDFLKVILFRLIWKNLMGLGKHVGPYQLYIALEQFEKKLNINNDQHINELKVAIDKYAKSKSHKDEYLIFIKRCLQEKLQTICESLGCHLIEPMTVNDDETMIPNESKNIDVEAYVQCLGTKVTTDKIDVDHFIDHLNPAFKLVSFDIIQLIIKYIREINQ